MHVCMYIYSHPAHPVSLLPVPSYVALQQLRRLATSHSTHRVSLLPVPSTRYRDGVKGSKDVSMRTTYKRSPCSEYIRSPCSACPATRCKPGINICRRYSSLQ